MLWAKSNHGKQLSLAAARLLVDLAGEDMGPLDQEMGKLSAYVGTAAKIDVDDVQKVVGNSRSENIWKIFDSLGNGNLNGALHMLDRRFVQGEEPLRMRGAFSVSPPGPGRIALAGAAGPPRRSPLRDSGAEQQPDFGKRRVARIHDWLLEVDSGPEAATAVALAPAPADSTSQTRANTSARQ